MNQRNYDWDTEPQIIKFLNDLFCIFYDTNFYEKMGSIIYYTGNKEGKEVWDGQQRIITIILVIKAISTIASNNFISNEREKKESINFSNSVNTLLREDTDSLVNIPDRIKGFWENPKFKDFINIPKIHCINPYDNDAICEIFNGYKPLITYEKVNIINHDENNEVNDENKIIAVSKSESESESESESDENYGIDNENTECFNKTYECKLCDKRINIKGTTNRERDFVRHLKTCHDYDDTKINSKDTKIYKAFEFICRNIKHRFTNLKNLKEFYQFILNYIDLNVYECNDLDYVSKIFEWENNRGKPVSTLDVIKNILLSNIPDEKKIDVYDKWNDLKLKSHSKINDYGQKIFNCAIQIYNKKITRNMNQEEQFKKMVKNTKKNTYAEIKLFFGIVENLFLIIEKLENDRYGKLILYNKRCSIVWEGFNFLLLPIIYFTCKIDKKVIELNDINKKTIELIVRWYYRNIGTKNITFNGLIYSNPFIEISNNVINDPKYNYYEEILKILKKNKNISINKDNYLKSNNDKEWKHSLSIYAKMLLYFLETKLKNDNSVIHMDDDLEHIYPEKNKNKLEKPNLIYKLGNLTILEGKNSVNGHKGNRSIKDKDFGLKKKQYENSEYRITRNICKYENFDIKTIEDRTIELFELLEKYTDY